jgi:hypothetical protein
MSRYIHPGIQEMDINSIGSVSSIASLATDMSNQRLNDQIATIMQQKANNQIGGTTLQLLGGAIATTDQAQQIQGASQTNNQSNSANATNGDNSNVASNTGRNNPPHLGKNVDVLA